MNCTTLAQMWDSDHMSGGWWWAMGIGWLLFLALIGVGVVLLARSFSRDSPTRSSAADLLAERFARGEIDEDEYQRRRDVLSGCR